MASNSCIPSSSSSSSTPQWEVFLSFRGKDTREKFVGHLYTALYQKGILTFKDDEKLKKGRSIGPELLKTIEESRYSIVVLSENYASSSWCLDELVHILHSYSCKNNAVGRRQSTIYPVFYHVDPSNVRHQDGSFGEGFAKAASKHGEEKAQKWREALKEVADLAGWEYPSNQYRSESKFIQELAGKICSEGEGIYASVTEDLSGIHSRVDKVIQLLGLGLDDHARAVGIWGMGGIGKTTIAREVCRRVRHQFEAFSYLENVREVSMRNGLATLQGQLISETLWLNDLDTRDTFTGERMIRNRVCNKKVLFVLDDVDQLEQLENLVGKLDQFKVGSRIIITTRDKQLLIAYDITDIYQVEMLNQDESIKLFISKVFGNKEQQTRVFRGLVKHVAEYAGGVPLALKVLGSSLRGKEESKWKSALDKLKGCLDKKVHQALEISYGALDPIEQQIFLDIACFLKGMEKTRAMQILKSCDFPAEYGISVLVDKSLVSFEHNKVWMHDLTQQLGRDIVRQESKNPGKHSRLWLYNDVYHVLMNNTGTEAVQSIVLQPSEKKELINLGAKAFTKMTRLRLLEICNVQLPNGLEYLSNELRYLKWDGYPLKRYPETFRPKYLVELHLSKSCVEQLWDGKLLLPNLRLIDFWFLENLTKIPDLTGTPALESVVIGYCDSLAEFHQSVGALTKLNRLCLVECRNLRSLPTSMDYTSLEFLKVCDNSELLKFPEILKIPKSLKVLRLTGAGVKQLFSDGHLTNLTSLDLTDCVEFESFRTLDLSGCPKLMNNMKRLEELKLRGTGIIELPLSFGHLENLTELDLSNCQNLRSLPSKLEFVNLRSLDLSDCPKLMNIPEIFGNMKRLWNLHLGRTGIIELPSSVGYLENLIELDLSHCQNLRSLPDCICQLEDLRDLNLGGCSNLEKLPSSSGAPPMELERLLIYGCKRITSDSLNSFLSFSLSRESLCLLDMEECNLKSVPPAICSLCSLHYLSLGRNDFESLPAGMYQLFQLMNLNLEGCKRLEELPESPQILWFVQASDCQSLITILSPSTYESVNRLDLSNCIRLLRNEQLLEEFLLAVSQSYFGWSGRGREIIFPGSEIPKWFSRDKVELHSTNNRCYLGYAACAVVEIEKTYEHPDEYAYHRVHPVAQLNIEDRLFGDMSSGKRWRPTDTETLWITFGGLGPSKDEIDQRNRLGGSATFTITPTRPGFKIKSCGLRLMFQKDYFCDPYFQVTRAVEEEEDNDDVVAAPLPKRRRLGCSETVNLNDNVDHEEEEEDRPDNNQKLRQFFEPIAMDLDLNEEATVEEDPSMDDVVGASLPKRRRLGCSETGDLNDNVDHDNDEEEEDGHHNNQKLRQFFEPIAMDLDLNEEAIVEEDPSMDSQPRI